MCGIAGVLSPEKNVSPEVLKKMAASLAHRGPDGEAVWTNADGAVGFAHRRLSILDLSDDGRQPMHSADSRFTIVFNGEIYNYLEIREQLEKKGCRFRSRCDTEVLLAAFQEKGEQCLDELDGMFAFAVWDERERKLFCARDRFGEKPFNYAFYDGAFFFASEIKALRAAGVPSQVSEKMLFNFLARSFMQNPSDLSETFFENVKKLKPAHYFYISPDRPQARQQKYWDIDPRNIDRQIGESEAAEKFRNLFDRSVERRLRSDVPVGSSFSGGLDSSLVVCTIDELKKGRSIPQATFSARFPGFAKDEGRFMQIVIERANVRPHFVFPDEQGLIDDLEKLFYHQEEPFPSASIYAQFCVMRLAKEAGVTVLLDGQGADELLAGYKPYFFDYFDELRKTDRRLWAAERRFHRRIHSGADGAEQKLKTALKYFLPRPLKTKIAVAADRFDLAGFLDRDFFAAQIENYFSPPPDAKRETLADALYADAFGGNLENLLRFADRNSMAHSREVRLPFLSRELAEFLFSLPAHFKIRNGVTKYIMREAFRDRLPAEIAARQDKIGYEPPQNDWLERPLMRERLRAAGEFLVKNSFVRAGAFEKLGAVKNDARLWKILMAEMVFTQNR